MKPDTKKSKFLSLVLRHRPEVIGLSLDASGFTPVDELLQKLAAHGRPLSRDELEALVRDNDKQRFAFSDDGTRIRASQGHSVEVDLAYPASVPPEHLFHGTVGADLSAIFATGLRKMKRHAVHLSPDQRTARIVGGRRGKPVILRVSARRMHEEGFAFSRSANGVWLTDEVPARYLEIVEDAGG